MLKFTLHLYTWVHGQLQTLLKIWFVCFSPILCFFISPSKVMTDDSLCLGWCWTDCSASSFTCPFPCGYQGSGQSGAGGGRCSFCRSESDLRGETVTSLQCVCVCVCVCHAVCCSWASPGGVNTLRLSAQQEERSAEKQLNVVGSLGNHV